MKQKLAKTLAKSQIKPSQISAPSPKLRKYLYAKIMAYTVISHIAVLICLYVTFFFGGGGGLMSYLD